MSKDFDDILKRRYVPEMRSNLAQRISQAALREKNTHIQENIFFQELWSSFLDSIIIPKPAYSLAMMLVLAVGIGFYSSSDLLVSPSGSLSSSEAYFAVTESLVYGELL